MTTIEKTKKQFHVHPGHLFASLQPKQGERIMIIGGSETLASRCSDAGAAVFPAVSFNQVRQGEFDSIAAPLSLHVYGDGALWINEAYKALKPGGWFVADLAEGESLSSVDEFPYAQTLAGYWERLNAVGFGTILVEQITANTVQEAIANGWTELIPSRYPVTVNRFIAVK